MHQAETSYKQNCWFICCWTSYTPTTILSKIYFVDDLLKIFFPSTPTAFIHRSMSISNCITLGKQNCWFISCWWSFQQIFFFISSVIINWLGFWSNVSFRGTHLALSFFLLKYSRIICPKNSIDIVRVSAISGICIFPFSQTIWWSCFCFLV